MHAETNRQVTVGDLSQSASFDCVDARVVGGADRGVSLLSYLRRVWTDWRARRALDSLPDDILRDIGLTRADVSRETMQPFWTPLDYDCLEAQRRRAPIRSRYY